MHHISMRTGCIDRNNTPYRAKLNSPAACKSDAKRLKRLGLDPVKDVQILTPMNRGGLGARSLNAELQKILNEKSEPKGIRLGTTFLPVL